MRQRGELLRRRARVEVIGEVIDRLVGGLEKAERLGFEPELHRAAGLRLDRDEMRHDAQDMLGVARDYVVPGDARLEAERRGLDRGRDVVRRDIGEDVGDVDRVAGAFFRAPVRLVHLLLHHRALEGAVGEGVDGVEVHVVVAEEFLQLVALGGAARERLLPSLPTGAATRRNAGCRAIRAFTFGT